MGLLFRQGARQAMLIGERRRTRQRNLDLNGRQGLGKHARVGTDHAQLPGTGRFWKHGTENSGRSREVSAAPATESEAGGEASPWWW